MSDTVAPRGRKKRIVVCADDFGLTDRGCESIVRLAAIGAISATTCAADGRYLRRHARALRDSSSRISLGLHFNLTEHGNERVCAGLGTWLIRGYVLRSSDAQALQHELKRQLSVFEDVFERAPAFLDGHEHVHQLPGIAEVLLEELLNRYGRSIAVRSTVAQHHRGLKAQAIATLGGYRLRRLLSAHQVTTNSDFAGAYDFSTRVPFGRRMQGWLTSIEDGGLIMCHPELPAAAITARGAEHEFLVSASWPSLVAGSDAVLVPFAAAVPTGRSQC